MVNPIEIVKAHPLATAGTVVVLIGAYILLSGPSNNTTQVDNTQTDLNGSIALQQLQGENQAKMFAVSAQRDVELAANETQKYVAGLEAQNNAASIAANLTLGTQQIGTNAVSTDLANTLAEKIAADHEAFLASQSHDQYTTLAAQIASQQAIAQSSINAQVKVARINKPHRGFFSSIFD